MRTNMRNYLYREMTLKFDEGIGPESFFKNCCECSYEKTGSSQSCA